MEFMNYTMQTRSQAEGEGGIRDLKNMPFNAML